jgi:hypothetical protein
VKPGDLPTDLIQLHILHRATGRVCELIGEAMGWYGSLDGGA